MVMGHIFFSNIVLKKLDAKYCNWYYSQCLDFVFFLLCGFCCVPLKSVKFVFQSMDLLTD